MFTGIIKEVGKVKSVTPKGDLYRLEVLCVDVAEGISIGDSVAVNGVCLSVVRQGRNSGLFFDVVKNTMKGTNLKRLKPGSRVNLENAVRVGESLSGHIVSGHVDGERRIKAVRKTPAGDVLDIGLNREDSGLLVPRGSIAVDGISLTVGELFTSFLRIFIIPHTLDNTSLRDKRAGDYANVEFEITGKYIRRSRPEEGVTRDILRGNGFL